MFDELMQKGFAVLQNVHGEASVVYRSPQLTKTVVCVWANVDQSIEPNSDFGADRERKMRVARVHIPTDAENGIPKIDARAILEKDGELWAIQTIQDITGTAATVMATRTLEYETTARGRK